MQSRGLFLTVEGGEGVGKSTNITYLAKKLQQQGVELVVTREPGGTEVGESIRQVLLQVRDESVGGLTEILLMFADGLLNKQIASQLGTSESTIKSHASIIFLKLGVRNRTQAVITLNELQLNQSTFGH